ncbi:hypothetical protein K0M31_009058 [Melipona bicolor]|uniref:Neurotransmitter-gated ion-channel transmembrane domain-containing protein n=1 Tax=Melipona bicolor TaxID=60889 RepID=A0AA40FPH1_9HYME|nr:hypothetical protein K0M31_009058 [Melipona bicolor]
MVDYEDEFDEFGDSKCSLCQRRFEEQGNYSCLKVDLIFTRDRAFYFTTVFIPGIILVTSSFITFWLEWNAVPARVMIGVTTMLNFFTTSNGFRSTLPVVSNLTAMNVWDGVCMCFIYASLLEFVCVNYVGRKRPMHNVVYRPGENPVTQVLLLSDVRAMSISTMPTPRDSGETLSIERRGNEDGTKVEPQSREWKIYSQEVSTNGSSAFVRVALYTAPSGAQQDRDNIGQPLGAEETCAREKTYDFLDMYSCYKREWSFTSESRLLIDPPNAKTNGRKHDDTDEMIKEND